MSDTMIIGVGNRYRGDDGVGHLIAAGIEELQLPDLQIVYASGEAAGLMDLWAGHARVYIFDAVSSGAKPGTVFRFDAIETPVPSGFFNYSTHAFSVAEAIELARQISALPRELVVFGVEGEDFDHGVHVTPLVRDSVNKVVARVAKELSCTRPH